MSLNLSSSYMVSFVLLVFVTTVTFVIAMGTYVFGVIRAAKTIHALLIDSILGTTLRWLDQTPVSRVITRCTKDIKALDGQFAGEFRWLGTFSASSTAAIVYSCRTVSVSAQLITQLVAIALVTPAVILPGIGIFLVGAFFGNIYMKAQLPVKREMSNKKAPVLGHFGAAITGLSAYHQLLRILDTDLYSLHSCIRCAGSLPAGIIQAHRELHALRQDVLQPQPLDQHS